MIKVIIFTMSLVSFLYSLPAFPGAEGWGAENTGGRGGKVLFVTSTASSGAGTLLAALAQRSPRIIIFKTSGVISQVTSGFQLNSNYSNVTVAGQTSPGGITLTGKMAGNALLYCYDQCRDVGRFHDGVFRFLRLRADADNNDGITLEYSNNFIFDHCDFSGAYDETQDFCYSTNFTMQWCGITNSSQGQVYGTLIAYADINRITMHHNLWANHVNRMPHMHWGYAAAPDGGLIDYRNNVCFNFQIYTLSICCVEGSLKFNVAGNYFKAGLQTPSGTNNPQVSGIPSAELWTSDNLWHGMGGSASQYNLGGSRSTANAMPAVTTESAANAYNSVLDKMGAWPRDAMNTRTVAEVRNQTGQYRKDNDPLITTGPAWPADADNDGMPDFWESAMGFNPNDSAGKNADHDSDGYTNIEEYINDLALARLCRDYYNPPYPIPSTWPDHNPGCCKSLELEELRDASAGVSLIKAVPNPVSGSALYITLPESRGRLLLIDVAGRTIADLPARGKMVLDAGKIARGVYALCLVENGQMSSVKKIVVVK